MTRMSILLHRRVAELAAEAQRCAHDYPGQCFAELKKLAVPAQSTSNKPEDDCADIFFRDDEADELQAAMRTALARLSRTPQTAATEALSSLRQRPKSPNLTNCRQSSPSWEGSVEDVSVALKVPDDVTQLVQLIKMVHRSRCTPEQYLVMALYEVTEVYLYECSLDAPGRFGPLLVRFKDELKGNQCPTIPIDLPLVTPADGPSPAEMRSAAAHLEIDFDLYASVCLLAFCHTERIRTVEDCA